MANIHPLKTGDSQKENKAIFKETKTPGGSITPSEGQGFRQKLNFTNNTDNTHANNKDLTKRQEEEKKVS